MSEKRFTIKSTATELELYDNGVKIGEFPHYEWVARPVDYVVKTLNEQQANINKLKSDIEETEISIKLFADDVNRLSKENEQLKDYIDTIFEDNTHICKYLDVEDVQFYCDKNKNYRNPSCLYKKCFDEENLIKIKDEIRRVLE